MTTRLTGRNLLVATTLALSFAHLVVACVDGVTPDCSGNAKCGPNLDGSLDGSSDSSLVFPEAATDAPNEAAVDAGPDGDARSDG